MKITSEDTKSKSFRILNYIILVILLGGCGLYQKVKVLVPSDDAVQKTIIEKMRLLYLIIKIRVSML